MTGAAFRTDGGIDVPAVTADGMRAVDRVAVEDVDLGLLQMMENAGRILAETAVEMAPEGEIAVFAGGGGNGGGGLCSARHLANRGRDVTIVLDRPTA
jgi:NAD(P)H-hydrate epimerase